ncbi:MAG: T9SS type A sorting domain-containing protein [Candidatus Neomarinimicrobiota bacterium]|nr:T9SS type A sorting domain-containing protein [Candidatus Neomarinimicrobiota bacterium]
MKKGYMNFVRSLVFVALVSPSAMFAGSYDFEQGGMVFVSVPQLSGENKWSMEFFVAYHGDSWQNEQVYIERYPDPSSDEADIYIRSYYDNSGSTPDMVVELHAEPYTTADEPLELRLAPSDISVDNFNWVYAQFNNNKLGLFWSNGTDWREAEKEANGGLHGSEEPFEFGAGGGESQYTMDEVHFALETRQIGGTDFPPKSRYGPMSQTVMLWHFDEMSGNTIVDESTYGNDGDVDGQGAWEDRDAFEGGGGGPGPGTGGRIGGLVFFDGDLGFVQLHLGLWFVGNESGNPDMSEKRGENSPFPPGGVNYSFQDPQITANSGPYWVEAFIDLNNNSFPDEDEPSVLEQAFTNNNSEAFVDLYLGGVFDPPEIVNISNSDAHEGEDMVINVGIASEAGIANATFEYMIGGSTSLRTIDLGGDEMGGDWAGTIPGSDITNKGLMGTIFVEDLEGQIVASEWEFINVGFDEISIGSTSGETYRMISAPGDLDDKASPIGDLVTQLQDADRSDDATEFRTFRWNGSDYTETDLARLNPGEAYWIITLDSWTLTGGSGKSIDLESPVSISLKSGWNQVGSPYNFTPNLYEADEGAVEGSFYRYTGSGYSTTTTMSPGDGYWVYAYSSTSLKVGFDPGMTLARESVHNPFDWKGNIIARVNGVDDSENVFGVMAGASETWDTADRHEPPVIGDYISVAFDNRHWSERGGFYGTDVHSPTDTGHEWPFLVKTNQEGVVSLDFEWTQSLPSDWDVALIDAAAGTVIDLRADPAYDFACACDESGREFIIVTGPPSFIQGAMDVYDVVPADYRLAQNFPNPFNAVTTLRFSVPEESAVSIVIYDLLGQKITTLADRTPYGAGNHALIWDGRDNLGNMMSTGVYFYRMEAVSGGKAVFQDARKLIMLK